MAAAKPVRSLPAPAVPDHRCAICVQHGVDEGPELGRKLIGKLAVGLQHGLIGVKTLEVACFNTLHDFAYQGLVTVIQHWNIDYGEPRRIR